jgi:hypothetical protein
MVKEGETPVLSPGKARRLMESIEMTPIAGQRDGGLIEMMIYSLTPPKMVIPGGC